MDSTGARFAVESVASVVEWRTIHVIKKHISRLHAIAISARSEQDLSYKIPSPLSYIALRLWHE